MPTTWVPLNLNTIVRFKLTDAHQRAWEASQRRGLGDTLYARFGRLLSPDSEGMVHLPLWQFAYAFGSELVMGSNTISPVIEMEVTTK